MYNPLAMQRIRQRAASLKAQVAAGEITAQQAQARLRAFKIEMIDRVRFRAKPPDTKT